MPEETEGGDLCHLKHSEGPPQGEPAGPGLALVWLLEFRGSWWSLAPKAKAFSVTPSQWLPPPEDQEGRMIPERG